MNPYSEWSGAGPFRSRLFRTNGKDARQFMDREAEKEPKPEWTLERFVAFIQVRASRLSERLADMEEDLVCQQLATEIEVACADVLREIAQEKAPVAGEERKPLPSDEGTMATNEVRREQR